MEANLPKLWDHQQKAVERAYNLTSFALFFEPGTGKTRTTIEILRDKFNVEGEIIGTLILCPPVVISNWKNEWMRFSKIPSDRVVLLTGSGKERLMKFISSDPNSIFVTNYEGLLMKDLYASLVKWIPGRAVVLDEMHKIKDSTTKRAKACHELGRLAKYRFGLTGTPILNSYMDAFSQFKFLDLGKSFGSNFFSFRATYFYDKNANMPSSKHFPDWRLKPGVEDRITSIIHQTSAFAEKRHCLDLPPLVKEVYHIPMGKEQQRLYDEMKMDFIATIKGDDGKLRASIAELALTKALRLQQIVSGHIKVENGDGTRTTLSIKDNPRRQALFELLESLAPYHKTLVWAVFKDNYADIRSVCDELGLKYVELHGEVKNKQEAVERFSNDPDYRVLIGHPGSGGIGVNLVAASYSIFYSRSFSLEFDIQAEARNYRGGSERHESITRIDLVTPGTIDELVLKALASKQELGEKLLYQYLEEL